MTDGGGGGAGGERRSVAERLAEIEEVEFRIEKLVSGGDGLGRFDGIPVFVARTVPGDRVRARIIERRPRYARAELVALEEAGPGRREPRCRHFEECGGCDLQHVEDDLQVALKVAAARETLERLGGLDLPTDQTVVRGRPWGYRLRAQLQVDPHAEPVRVGYFARRSHRLVAISECPVLVPQLESFAATAGSRLTADGPRRIDVAVGDGDSITCAPAVEGLPRGEVSIKVDDDELDFDARTFFQCHRGLLSELVAHVVGDWHGSSAYDLYAGVGLFSLPLARRYERVTAVEGDRIAARYLRRNARRARLGHVEIVNAAVESKIGEIDFGVDRIVVDPPRGGLTPRIVERLAAVAAHRLTYVSCHEAALARDLRQLARGYRIESLAFVDLFPQTAHLETVVQLRLAQGGE